MEQLVPAKAKETEGWTSLYSFQHTELEELQGLLKRPRSLKCPDKNCPDASQDNDVVGTRVMGVVNNDLFDLHLKLYKWLVPSMTAHPHH